MNEGANSLTQLNLGPEDIAEGELRSYEAGGRYILVTRLEGQLHALDDMCNHAGCLLSEGFLENEAVVCPCHEFAFDVRDGRLVTKPRLCDDQPNFRVWVQNGQIVVNVSDSSNSPDCDSPDSDSSDPVSLDEVSDRVSAEASDVISDVISDVVSDGASGEASDGAEENE